MLKYEIKQWNQIDYLSNTVEHWLQSVTWQQVSLHIVVVAKIRNY